MSFTNLYYKRVRSPQHPSIVCYKPTTTVLATINTVDFFYTCATHLTDPGFGSPVVDPKPATDKPALTEEDISKVIAEWKDRQKKKKAEEEKEKEKKDKDKQAEGKSNDKSENNNKAKDKDAADSPKFPGSLSPKPTPTHERFTLHRDMFALRQGEHRKRRQTAQAKDLARQIPSAPRGTL
ncbi:VPS4-associated protein 1 [Mycena rebaudengoi]|nr:VPS4-associated protein 1 [Mycena rebaudengoi]